MLKRFAAILAFLLLSFAYSFSLFASEDYCQNNSQVDGGLGQICQLSYQVAESAKQTIRSAEQKTAEAVGNFQSQISQLSQLRGDKALGAAKGLKNEASAIEASIISEIEAKISELEQAIAKNDEAIQAIDGRIDSLKQKKEQLLASRSPAAQQQLPQVEQQIQLHEAAKKEQDASKKVGDIEKQLLERRKNEKLFTKAGLDFDALESSLSQGGLENISEQGDAASAVAQDDSNPAIGDADRGNSDVASQAAGDAAGGGQPPGLDKLQELAQQAGGGSGEGSATSAEEDTENEFAQTDTIEKGAEDSTLSGASDEDSLGAGEDDLNGSTAENRLADQDSGNPIRSEEEFNERVKQANEDFQQQITDKSLAAKEELLQAAGTDSESFNQTLKDSAREKLSGQDLKDFDALSEDKQLSKARNLVSDQEKQAILRNSDTNGTISDFAKDQQARLQDAKEPIKALEGQKFNSKSEALAARDRAYDEARQIITGCAVGDSACASLNPVARQSYVDFLEQNPPDSSVLIDQEFDSLSSLTNVFSDEGNYTIAATSVSDVKFDSDKAFATVASQTDDFQNTANRNNPKFLKEKGIEFNDRQQRALLATTRERDPVFFESLDPELQQAFNKRVPQNQKSALAEFVPGANLIQASAEFGDATKDQKLLKQNFVRFGLHGNEDQFVGRQVAASNRVGSAETGLAIAAVDSVNPAGKAAAALGKAANTGSKALGAAGKTGGAANSALAKAAGFTDDVSRTKVGTVAQKGVQLANGGKISQKVFKDLKFNSAAEANQYFNKIGSAKTVGEKLQIANAHRLAKGLDTINLSPDKVRQLEQVHKGFKGEIGKLNPAQIRQRLRQTDDIFVDSSKPFAEASGRTAQRAALNSGVLGNITPNTQSAVKQFSNIARKNDLVTFNADRGTATFFNSQTGKLQTIRANKDFASGLKNAGFDVRLKGGGSGSNGAIETLAATTRKVGKEESLSGSGQIAAVARGKTTQTGKIGVNSRNSSTTTGTLDGNPTKTGPNVQTGKLGADKVVGSVRLAKPGEIATGGRADPSKVINRQPDRNIKSVPKEERFFINR